MLPALLLCADLAGTLDVSDRTELRARVPSPIGAAASVDAETAVTARLNLSRRQVSIMLAYMPTLTLWDIESASRVLSLLNGGEGRLEWRGKHASLFLSEAASYGGTSFASFAPVPGPEGQAPRIDALPTPRVFQILSST